MAELPLLATDQQLLSVLRWADNDDLQPLVEYIIKKGGLTESLSSSDAYKRNCPNHTAYVDEIAAEIQLFGANTFRTAVRGHGVKYETILNDVAKKLKVKRWFRTVDEIERDIHLKVLGEAYAHASEEQRKKMLEELGVNVHRDLQGQIPATLPAVGQTAIAAGGFLPYQLAVIVANAVTNAAVGHGLSFAGNALLTKSISVFAGPLGWAVSAMLLMNSLFAGPAYRVTIPSVIHISYLRAKKRQEAEQKRRAGRLRKIKIAVVSAAVVIGLAALVALAVWARS